MKTWTSRLSEVPCGTGAGSTGRRSDSTSTLTASWPLRRTPAVSASACCSAAVVSNSWEAAVALKWSAAARSTASSPMNQHQRSSGLARFCPSTARTSATPALLAAVRSRSRNWRNRASAVSRGRPGNRPAIASCRRMRPSSPIASSSVSSRPLSAWPNPARTDVAPRRTASRESSGVAIPILRLRRVCYGLVRTPSSLDSWRRPAALRQGRTRNLNPEARPFDAGADRGQRSCAPPYPGRIVSAVASGRNRVRARPPGHESRDVRRTSPPHRPWHPPAA